MLNSINTNIAAYSAQGNIGKASNSAASSIARLSSGSRIVKSSDDVASLSIGTSLKTGVTTLKQALANTAQGSSLLQVADGALAQIGDLLQRQKAIATQANSGTLSDTERGYLNQEFQALKSQIDQISTSASFSSVKLLDGSLSGSNPLQSAHGGATIDGAILPSGITNVAFTDVAGNTTTQDTSFIGDLSKGTWKVDFDGTTGYAVSFNINGSTYSKSVAAIATGGTSLVLTNGNGNITLTFANASWTTSNAAYTASTGGAQALQDNLTAMFAGATAFAERAVLSTNAQTSAGVEVAGSAIRAEDSQGTTLTGFTGANVTLRSENFKGSNLPAISDFKATGYDTGARFEVTVDGKTYRTQAAASSPTDLSTTTAFGSAGVMTFYLDGDNTSNERLVLNFGTVAGAATTNLSTQNGVNGFVNTLNDLFGRSGGGLTLQVGALATDTLSVSIGDVSSDKLYIGKDGAVAKLDVSTLQGAKDASQVLDTAIAKINSQRADVGALQSRVDFTASNLQISIQNQDAARGTLLDTDVAAESTAYATAQVQLQAGIAVLAQANQLPQNLLKLIS